jgi:hypothetical protein
MVARLKGEAMKTLADLKRDARTGRMYMLMVERFGSTEIIDRLKGVRPVIGCNTVAITLRNQDGKPSDMRFEAATLTEYTGDTLTIYEPGKRELTPEEQAVLNKAVAERKAYEEKYPHSGSYYIGRSYIDKSRFPYINGDKTIHGKRYDYKQIIDNQIKGETALKYKVCFADSLEEAIQILDPKPVLHQLTLDEYLTA